MTREEAIKIIKNEEECVLTDCFRPSCESCNLVMETDAILTALDMAIKALEQPEPCEDAVSRAEAIKCITYDEEYMEECLRQLPSVTPKQSNYKTDHGYMWICPDCGLVVHSDFEKCVRCGCNREEKRSQSE